VSALRDPDAYVEAYSEDIVEALVAARGCGCCGDTADLVRLLGCSPACARYEEDGDVFHTYDDGCAAHFPDGVRRALARLVEGARR
jgi:hypothetical protein